MTVWQVVDDWTYEYFELDSPASDFPGFEDIIELWLNKRNGRSMPSWADFDFYDFKGWHGKVSKMTISYNPFNYKVDLFGQDFVNLVESDWTNYSGTEIIEAYEDSDIDMYFYEMMCTQKYISRTSGPLPVTGQEGRHTEIIELPLSDDDGKTVTHTIEIMK